MGGIPPTSDQATKACTWDKAKLRGLYDKSQGITTDFFSGWLDATLHDAAHRRVQMCEK